MMAPAPETWTALNDVGREFVGLARHDLRSPLNTLVGFGGLLAGQVGGDDRSAFRHICDKADEYEKLVEGVLGLWQMDLPDLRAAAERGSALAVAADIRETARRLATTPIPGLSDRQLESVVRIARSANRLHAMIECVSTYWRLETGLLPVNVRPARATDLVVEVVSAVMEFSAERDTHVRHDAIGTDEAWMEADPRAFACSLRALVDGVAKSCGAGSVIEVTIVPTGHLVQVAVSAPGLTVPDVTARRVCTPFGPLGSDSRVVPGAGLHVSLAKGLAEIGGGGLSVDSPLGQDSTYWLQFRAAEPVGSPDVLSELAAPVR